MPLAQESRKPMFALRPADGAVGGHAQASLGSARSIANIYLGSLGASPLGDEEDRILGMSESDKCYVSLEYFCEDDPLADYVVHEAAHIFHNLRRETIGLPNTRRRVRLLDIDYRMRETFAYACEAYSCIRALSKGPSQRAELLAEYKEAPVPNDERVDSDEVVDILAEANEARNGWKRILRRCSNRHGVRYEGTQAAEMRSERN